MEEDEAGFFAVIGRSNDLSRTRPTNAGPYLVSFRLAAGEAAIWGNRVVNFGISPDIGGVTRVDEQIPLLSSASRLTLVGLTDLSMIGRHQGRLRVRFHTVACESPDETHEFGLTGPRRLESGADIKALEFELNRYTGYAGITVIDIALVVP